MKLQANVPRGVRDFSQPIMQKRQFIIHKIKRIFSKFAYSPIETPALETLTTLTGKYGNEEDKLIYKILNSGNYLEKIDENLLDKKNTNNLTKKISTKGLRYDLTVPFARYVATNFNKINFPFRRYQIQPVWRADRPQRGRFREFYQCDADIIGSTSLWLEVELLHLFDAVFSALKIPVIIKVNNRKILNGIIEKIAKKNYFKDIITALDKLDKVGKETVLSQLKEKELPSPTLNKLEHLIDISLVKDNSKADGFLSEFYPSDIFTQGKKELDFVLHQISALGLKSTKVQFNPLLARGLDYYTGMIFEVFATDNSLGAIGGGGRYDNLTGNFGIEDISGVGISFGVDRIFLLMEEANLFPDFSASKTQLLFANFGEGEAFYCLRLMGKLRNRNIISELYPDIHKIKKQLQYADRKKIPFVVLIGSDEYTQSQILIKDMKTGKQKHLTEVELFSKNLLQKIRKNTDLFT